MNKLITWLENKNTLLTATLMVMSLYVVHNAFLLAKLEHLDLSFEMIGYKWQIFNAAWGLWGSLVTEFIALIAIINGRKNFGHFYAIATCVMNTFYLIYFDPVKLWPVMFIAAFISLIHLAAIWTLTDMFYDYRKDKMKDDLQLTIHEGKVRQLSSEITSLKRQVIEAKLKTARNDKTRAELNEKLKEISI